MEEKPIKLSYVVPVYNAEDYLRQCVDSILRQNYDNFEIILVDDGSSDQSGAICDDYSKQDQRVKTIHQPNSGVAGARNAGIKEASGDYLFFVDNDDWIASDKVASLVSALEETHADLVINKYLITGSGPDSIGNGFINQSQINGKSREEVLNYFRTGRINIMAPWEYVVKRDILIRNNLFFLSDQGGVDDSYFSPILFCHCQSFLLTDDIRYYWRQRAGSQGQSHKPHAYVLKMLSTIEALKKSRDQIKEDYAKDYLSYCLYKNLFSLFGQYYKYLPADREYLRDWLEKNRESIKQAAGKSGSVHRLLNTLFGNFWGLWLGYKLATLKGKIFLAYYLAK